MDFLSKLTLLTLTAFILKQQSLKIEITTDTTTSPTRNVDTSYTTSTLFIHSNWSILITMKYKQNNRQIIPYKITDLVGKYMKSGNMRMLIIMLSCAILNEQQCRCSLVYQLVNYRKISKISLSMYKPPKLVTQKTLR